MFKEMHEIYAYLYAKDCQEEVRFFSQKKVDAPPSASSFSGFIEGRDRSQ
jgi:hypothetical protein